MSMRVRWREFELPSRVELVEDSKQPDYGCFFIEPYERGFGATIGNSLRRVLLSSIEGAGVVLARIDGVDHEFTSKPGVFEDVTHIVLNMKQIRVRHHDVNEGELFLKKSGKGSITAGDLEHDETIEVVNPELVLATLTEDVEFSAILRTRLGRGYQTAVENSGDDVH